MIARAYLRLASARNAGRIHSLDETAHTIGRAGSGAELELDDERVSTTHCSIALSHGRHLLRDLGSTNGTHVNGMQVREVFLADGDLIQCGETLLEYVCERAPAQRALVPVEYRAHLTAASEDQELDLQQLFARARTVLQFFLPYWRSIAVTTCVCMVAGAASYFVKPPSRKATFEVSLRPDVAPNPLAPAHGASLAFFDSAGNSFRSLPLITQTLRAMGETDLSPARIAEIQKNLDFVVLGAPRPDGPITYQGVLVDADPQWSVRFLDKHFKTYVDTEIAKALKQLDGQAVFLTRHLQIENVVLQNTERELVEFQKRYLEGLPGQARLYYDYLFDLRKALSNAEAEMRRLYAEVLLDKQRLGEEEELVDGKITSVQHYQSAEVNARNELARLLAEGKGPQHPNVIALQKQVQALHALAEEANDNPIVEKRRNPLRDAMKTSLAERQTAAHAAEQEALRLAKELQRVEVIVGRLPALEAEFAELNRTYDATKKLHVQLFERLQLTRIQMDLEQASIKSRYDIITPPGLEFVSPGKRILTRAASGGGIGFAASSLAAALRRRRRRATARPTPAVR